MLNFSDILMLSSTDYGKFERIFSQLHLKQESDRVLKYCSSFLISVILPGAFTQGASVFSSAGAVFTEKLIQASSENLFHLVPCLHSVQMLYEVHFKQFSLHFLHRSVSVKKN